MSKFELITHTSMREKESKNKTMLFSQHKTLKRWRYNKSSTPCISDTAPSKPSNIMSHIDQNKTNLQKLHAIAPKTQVLDINLEEYVPFVLHFCYLGSEIDFLLNNTNEIKIMINKANKAMRVLNFIQNAKPIALEVKIKLFLAIPVNLALWNGETWAENKNNLKLLDNFYCKAIRRILGIRIKRVCEECIKNEQIREWFRRVKALSHIWRCRILKYIS